MGIVLKKNSKIRFFLVFYRPNSGDKTPPAEQPTKCMWASHQVHVGIPVIFIRQPGSIAARAFPLRDHGEQLP
jgi:hypothetical protein